MFLPAGGRTREKEMTDSGVLRWVLLSGNSSPTRFPRKERDGARALTESWVPHVLPGRRAWGSAGASQPSAGYSQQRRLSGSLGPQAWLPRAFFPWPEPDPKSPASVRIRAAKRSGRGWGGVLSPLGWARPASCLHFWLQKACQAAPRRGLEA